MSAMTLPCLLLICLIHHLQQHGVMCAAAALFLIVCPPLPVTFPTRGSRGALCHLQGVDVREGLPPLRAPWIAKRPTGEGGVCTQMYYARQGVVTHEMAFVAAREGLDVELVRSEVARGRAIIPANRMHPELEPTIVGAWPQRLTSLMKRTPAAIVPS
jgi:Radical SAM ThiC family